MQFVAIGAQGSHLRLSADGRLQADGSRLDAAAVFERVRLGHGRVALRCTDGRYLVRRPDSRQNFALLAEPDLTEDGIFEEVLWPGDEVSLRCPDLTFVTAAEEGQVVVNRTAAGARERFRYVPLPAELVPAQVPRSVDYVPTMPHQRSAPPPRSGSRFAGLSAVRT